MVRRIFYLKKQNSLKEKFILKEIVPVELIQRIAKLHRGGTFKAITNIHKHKLIYHERKKYDG